MRLLIASGIASPDIGGPATFIDDVVPALVARGHDVEVIAFSEADAPPAIGAAPIVRIRRGPLPARWLAFARAYRQAAVRADVVLAIGLLLPRPTPRTVPVVLKVPGDYAWERARARAWIPGDENLEGFDQRDHPWRVTWMKRLRRAEARRATRIIVPSAFVATLVQSWGIAPERVVVVPNAVPLAMPAAGGRGDLRRSLGWTGAEPVLLTAGRLVSWKHVDLVIDAVAPLAGVRLVIAGDGPEREGLERQADGARARVEFTGTLSREALAAHMQAADYLLLYSSYEGLSHTLLEALRVGTPVIASRRGGNPEVVRHGVNGLLADHPDVGALRAVLREALAPGRRAELAAGAPVGFERFDHDLMVASLLAVLDAAIAERARPADHLRR